MPAYDCQTCGACCYNPDENVEEGFKDYALVNPRNALLRDAKLTSKYTFEQDGKRWLRMVGRVERCRALAGRLGKGVSCTIYAMRPTVCREVKPGSEECIGCRRARGLPIE